MQYLLGEYRTALINLFGPNALPREKASRRGAKIRVDAVPARDRRAFDQEPFKVEDEPEIDVEMHNDASGSDLDYNHVDEDGRSSHLCLPHYKFTSIIFLFC